MNGANLTARRIARMAEHEEAIREHSIMLRDFPDGVPHLPGMTTEFMVDAIAWNRRRWESLRALVEK